MDGIEWESKIRIEWKRPGKSAGAAGGQKTKKRRNWENPLALRVRIWYHKEAYERPPRSPGDGLTRALKLHCRREGEIRMSLEAIEKVTQIETENRERVAAAEAEAQKIVADAERDGLALLQQARSSAAESGKELLRQAEAKAAERAAEIDRAAQAEAAALRETAGEHLEEAVEFIVGRVVKH